MNDKQYNPAGNNEEAPAKGMAAVNTHNPEESDDLQKTGNQTLNTERLEHMTENDKNRSGRIADDPSPAGY